MSLGNRWLRHPQSVWTRKALFQVHLWTGIGIGVYILLISVSGSAVVFRPELLKAYTRGPTMVTVTGQPMTDEQLTEIASEAYPDYAVSRIWRAKRANQAVEIWLETDTNRKQRVFDPYTGQDLGDSETRAARFIHWLIDFHDNLLLGDEGRIVNGIGSILLILLCLTGIVIWWPGIESWRRSLTVEWRANWKRLNWGLHSAIGFWSFVFVLMWGISGVYLVFPDPFSDVVDLVQPASSTNNNVRLGDTILVWLARLHFGRFAGLPVKVLWVVLGLVPFFLFVTGAVMWWNRVLRPIARATRSAQVQEMEELSRAD